MEFTDLFAHAHILDVLKTFLYSDDTEILFSVDKCNENFTLLNVKSDGVEQKYFLVKIPKNLKINEEEKLNDSKVLHPVFIIENINKEYYGAFKSQHEIEHFVLPEQNNTQCLKIILQNLAEHQALELANSEKVVKSNLDKTVMKQSIENLQLAFNELFEGNNLFVRSIGCPLAINIYTNNNLNKSIFLNVLASTKIIPPAYDALLYIFALSDEKFRQEHFENLVLYYFESLIKSLQMLKSNVAEKITRRYREHQLKVLLPVVKFETINSLFTLSNSVKVKDLLANILSFFKYPLINQEDVYEATRNKIGSSHYDLLDYSLECLSEKNGHLGEYFHLDVKIKAQGKEQDLYLFAKFLITSTDAMEKVLKNGPSKKEEFFYNTLIPLFSNYGLDNLLDFSPRCYLSRTDWLLILDDFSRQGYVGFKPNTVLNYDGLRVIVEKFAKFHACSIILEEILSEKSESTVRLDESYGEFLVDTFLIYEDGHPLKSRYDSTLEVLYHIVKKFPEVTKKLNISQEELRARIKKCFLSVFAKVKKSDKIRNVINHGDVFVANMLFKFGLDNLITKGILVDFQMLRYVTPNYDLLVFLFCNSTKETRDKYLKVLIEEYYQYISENIKKFNYDPEVLFPKKLFDEDINFMMSAGITGAFINAHVFHIDPDFREEIAHDNEKYNYYLVKHKDELVDLSWKTEHYRNMMKGLVEDIVEIINTF